MKRKHTISSDTRNEFNKSWNTTPVTHPEAIKGAKEYWDIVNSGKSKDSWEYGEETNPDVLKGMEEYKRVLNSDEKEEEEVHKEKRESDAGILKKFLGFIWKMRGYIWTVVIDFTIFSSLMGTLAYGSKGVEILIISIGILIYGSMIVFFMTQKKSMIKMENFIEFELRKIQLNQGWMPDESYSERRKEEQEESNKKVIKIYIHQTFGYIYCIISVIVLFNITS